MEVDPGKAYTDNELRNSEWSADNHEWSGKSAHDKEAEETSLWCTATWEWVISQPWSHIKWSLVLHRRVALIWWSWSLEKVLKSLYNNVHQQSMNKVIDWIEHLIFFNFLHKLFLLRELLDLVCSTRLKILLLLHPLYIFFYSYEENTIQCSHNHDSDWIIEDNAWNIKTIIHGPRVFHVVYLCT